jgi:hypothetical protein
MRVAVSFPTTDIRIRWNLRQAKKANIPLIQKKAVQRSQVAPKPAAR